MRHVRRIFRLMHPFEKAGHGKAPFKCVGMTESWHGGGATGIPKKPGSCCDYCMTGIAYVFWIVSADGNRFKVGSDCVAKTPDRDLKREIKTFRAEHDRKAKTDIAARQKEARAKEREEVRAANVKASESHLIKLDEMAQGKNEYRSRTSKEMSAKIRDGMPVSVNMAVFIARMYSEHKAVRAHVGKIGEILDIDATISRVVWVGEFQIKGTWATQDQYRWHFKDAAGNVLIWKTSSGPARILEMRADRTYEPGERLSYIPADMPVRLRGKVKAHDKYQDEPQTMLERCKIERKAIEGKS